MTEPPRDPTPADGVLFGLPMAALALAVVLLLVPAVPAEWSPEAARTAQALRTSQERVADGRLPNDMELLTLAVGLRSTGDPDDRMRAALVELVWAQRLGLDSLRGLQRVITARKDLEAVLARRPANGHGWMMLALARVVMDEPAGATAALQASLATSGPDPDLMSLQLDLAVVLWDGLGQGARQRIAQRLDWIRRKPELQPLATQQATSILAGRLENARPTPD